MSLSSVLGDVGVNKVDDIGSDTGGEDSGEDHIGTGTLNH